MLTENSSRALRRGSRRRFLKTAAALASTLAVPQRVPRSVFGAVAPGNWINLGPIGCGHRRIRREMRASWKL